MKDIKKGLALFSADEREKEQVYRGICDTASVKPAKRVRLVPCLAAILLVALMTTSVLAVPAIRSFFVPNVGVVESEEAVAYRFLEEQVGASGNEYRFGYLYGDEAYVYMSTDRDYRELEGAASEELTVRLIEASGGSEAYFLNKKYTYQLIFSGLDETAVTDGIGFDGDVIKFEVEAAEYRSYSIHYGDETWELIPLKADNSAFHFKFADDKQDICNRTAVLSGYFIDEMGEKPLWRGIRSTSNANEGIMFLLDEPKNKLVGFHCDRFKIINNEFYEGDTLTLPLPNAGETISQSVSLKFADGLQLEDVYVELSRVGEGVDEDFPKGSLSVAMECQTVDGVIYTPYVYYADAYSAYLDGFLEYVSASPYDMTELPEMAPKSKIIEEDNRMTVITHYIPDGRDVIELRFGYDAEYPCDMTLEFES